MQQYDPVRRQQRMSGPEETVVAGATELLPALQQNVFGARTGVLVEESLRAGLLVAAQGQPDDVDVKALHGPVQGGAPAAPDVEQRHARLQSQLAQRQIDLGDLGLLQGHVGTFETRTAVGLGGVEEQPEEFIG
ncbi:hypothetical protein MSAR_02920 [Mycolicibacterium sarraceniae]|uniref:Uncharacterized protein n=1 Tax=Mycolicibacterium sarraceniae TaxID=1534348 RepID=A0A7I7SMP2_9MYCO|nr:hypothetical protein MSAR_02920 [Mycolicibacterium sarraceniae]